MDGCFHVRYSYKGNPVWLCKYTNNLCVARNRAALPKTNSTRRKKDDAANVM